MVPIWFLLGIYSFNGVTCDDYRPYKEEQQWKVLIRDIAFTINAVDPSLQIDQSLDRHILDDKSERGRGRKPQNNGQGIGRKENSRPASNTVFDPGDIKVKDPKPGHKQGLYNKEKRQSSDEATSAEYPITTENTSDVSPRMAAQFIVGGVLSMPRTWPWQASIQYLGADGAWHHFCGGSLVHARWIVTAAHCVTELEHHMVRIVLGEYQLTQTSSQEQVINPSRMLMHAYYDSASLYYDIAMVKLAHNPVLNLNVNTVSMATGDIVLDSLSTCYITGWGKTIGTSTLMSDTLQESLMTIVSKTECRRFYRDVIDTQVCVKSATSSACTGDSGSPLVCVHGQSWVLAGLASWIGNEFCEPTSPNVFTRISSYKEWVGNVTVNY